MVQKNLVWFLGQIRTVFLNYLDLDYKVFPRFALWDLDVQRNLGHFLNFRFWQYSVCLKWKDQEDP